jgi:hypothetical protein
VSATDSQPGVASAAGAAPTLNQATVELFRRRIATHVKRNVLYSVGLPGGGGSLIFIVVGLFLWLPENMKTYFESEQKVQQAVRSWADEYLEDAERVRPLVRREVEEVVPLGVRKVIRDEFRSSEVRDLLASELNRGASAYLDSPEGASALERAVQRAIDSPAVSGLIESAVDRQVDAATARVQQQLQGSRRSLVQPVAEVLIEGTEGNTPPQGLEKTSYEALRRYLSSPGAQRARDNGAPMILTLTIRRGPYYVAGAIDLYLRKLGEAFPDQSLHVVVRDHDKTFLAYIGAEEMLGALVVDSRPLMTVFTSSRDALDREAATQRLEAWFPASTRSVPADSTVFEALQATAWLPLPGAPEARAVVSASENFIGSITRAQLIDAIVK